MDNCFAPIARECISLRDDSQCGGLALGSDQSKCVAQRLPESVVNWCSGGRNERTIRQRLRTDRQHASSSSILASCCIQQSNSSCLRRTQFEYSTRYDLSSYTALDTSSFITSLQFIACAIGRQGRYRST